MSNLVISVSSASQVLRASAAYRDSAAWENRLVSRILPENNPEGARRLLLPFQYVAYGIAWLVTKLFRSSNGPGTTYQIKREAAALAAGRSQESRQAIVTWTRHVVREFDRLAKGSSGDSSATIYDIVDQALSELDNSVAFKKLRSEQKNEFKELAKIAFTYAIAELIAHELSLKEGCHVTRGAQLVASLDLNQMRTLTDDRNIDDAFRTAFSKLTPDELDEMYKLLVPHQKNKDVAYLLKLLFSDQKEAAYLKNLCFLDREVVDQGAGEGGDLARLMGEVNRDAEAQVFGQERELNRYDNESLFEGGLEEEGFDAPPRAPRTPPPERVMVDPILLEIEIAIEKAGSDKDNFDELLALYQIVKAESLGRGLLDQLEDALTKNITKALSAKETAFNQAIEQPIIDLSRLDELYEEAEGFDEKIKSLGNPRELIESHRNLLAYMEGRINFQKRKQALEEPRASVATTGSSSPEPRRESPAPRRSSLPPAEAAESSPLDPSRARLPKVSWTTISPDVLPPPVLERAVEVFQEASQEAVPRQETDQRLSTFASSQMMGLSSSSSSFSSSSPSLSSSELPETVLKEGRGPLLFWPTVLSSRQPNEPIINQECYSTVKDMMIKTSDIDPHYLYITYDNYAFDIRDIVEMAKVGMINSNPYKMKKGDTDLQRHKGSIQDFSRLIEMEKQALGSTVIHDTYKADLEGDRMKALSSLQKQLSDETIERLKVLGDVCSVAYIEQRDNLNPNTPAHASFLSFLSELSIEDSWDHLLVRTVALQAIKDFMLTLPSVERQALDNAQVSRWQSHPEKGGVCFPLAVHNALYRDACVEAVGTGIARLCRSLQEIASKVPVEAFQEASEDDEEAVPQHQTDQRLPTLSATTIVPGHNEGLSAASLQMMGAPSSSSSFSSSSSSSVSFSSSERHSSLADGAEVAEAESELFESEEDSVLEAFGRESRSALKGVGLPETFQQVLNEGRELVPLIGGEIKQVYRPMDSPWVIKTFKRFESLTCVATDVLFYEASIQLHLRVVPQIRYIAPESAPFQSITRRYPGISPVLVQAYIENSRSALDLPHAQEVVLFNWIMGRQDCKKDNSAVDRNGKVWEIDNDSPGGIYSLNDKHRDHSWLESDPAVMETHLSEETIGKILQLPEHIALRPRLMPKVTDRVIDRMNKIEERLNGNLAILKSAILSLKSRDGKAIISLRAIAEEIASQNLSK